MSLFKKTFLGFALFVLASCGFRPLYVGAESADSVSGERLISDLSSVYIDEISEHTGQILRRRLLSRISPKGNPEKPKYELSAYVVEASEYQQAIRLDNMATRTTMIYTVEYVFKTFPEGKVLLRDRTSSRASYNILESPYATDVAEEDAKKRMMEIIGDNISLRIAAYLKNKERETLEEKQKREKEAAE